MSPILIALIAIPLLIGGATVVLLIVASRRAGQDNSTDPRISFLDQRDNVGRGEVALDDDGAEVAR